MKFTLAIVIHLILFDTTFAQNDSSPSRTQILNELDQRLQENANQESVGSIAAVVIDGDKILWTNYYGWVDRKEKITPSSKTIYLIGSISKSVTSLALARLVDQDILKLDNPVEKYLPEITNIKNPLPEATPITIRQLATHTAGLAREPELSEAAKGPLEEWENKVLEAIPTTSYIGSPGEKHAYSNIGYGILGLVMCRAAKKPFDQLINDLVFEPLQMSNSNIGLPPEMEGSLAVSYDGTRDHNLGRGYKYPNGGVYSTLADMVNLVKAQLHTGFDEFLSESTWDEAQSFQVTTQDSEGEKYGYGLGVSVWTDKDKLKWVYHNGIVAPGYSASMYCALSSKMGIVILRNDEGKGDISGIADEFLYRLAEIENGK